MKEMKERFLSKVKFISAVNTLKQGIIFRKNSTEKISSLESFPTPIVYKEDHQGKPLKEVLGGNNGFSEHAKELKNEDKEWDLVAFPKEFIAAPMKSNYKDFSRSQKADMEETIKHEAVKEIEEHPSLSDFVEKCPPGGEDSVVFYTTSLRGIRKTFEDCSSIRFLLQSFKIKFQERDVSMHLEFRDELWKILESKVVPPKLFIRGRYIGGADEVVTLHEQGMLQKLLEGIPRNATSKLCSECANMRFMVCTNCNGSRKVLPDEEDDEFFTRCPECNENGLIKCPLCC